MIKRERVSTEIAPNQKYTNTELTAIADQILRDDGRSELCRECNERGTATGTNTTVTQGVQDGEGNSLVLDFPEYECGNGHRWFQGEGFERGFKGDSPILFEEHFQSRKRREIYCAYGTPDPEIVSGIYNRSHPQGRKINSEEQRRKNGASYYRS